MKKIGETIALLLTAAIISLPIQKVEAVSYVTDTGGGAYDECRAATNIAPAIALATVAIAGIVAIAVQNSHENNAHSSGCGSNCNNSHNSSFSSSFSSSHSGHF